MPSSSKTRISSSLITCPFASSFLPPDRNTVQQRILPFELLTSTVLAIMGPSQTSWTVSLCSSLPTSRLYRDRVCLSAVFLVLLLGYLWAKTVSQCGYATLVPSSTDGTLGSLRDPHFHFPERPNTMFPGLMPRAWQCSRYNLP